ncbi:1-aminocyclopropane-1-carboxylate deaminase/D-cysteine desulfhydrase [Thiomicrorhabdus cannonii]|uniref:1-aminocyclopropane-1-carboxylate deaminase/D-cysteine desulfhydrase n=1 Tax=Thiomicrorhabdus cannonii TaxID=2748011 RepID=UPI0015BF0F78|nr:pyridoxal-phosphate dependent enzyme [Thiomicrorhabdus cannonii]
MDSTKITSPIATIPTPLVRLQHPLFALYGVNVWIKRDDLNHPLIQGNKWHKLKYNLDAAIQQQKTALLTFGGAYSNHIAATACAAKLYGLESIGFIRGDELAKQADKWSHTLQTAAQNGMQLHFLSRQDYRLKQSSDFLATLVTDFPNAAILPEGGSNELALQGVGELMAEIETQLPSWTHLYCALGTGGTFSGLVKHAQPAAGAERHIYGVAVLGGAAYLLPQIHEWIGPEASVQWQLLEDYHAGGYGKLPAALQQFKQEMEARWQIPLDPVYNTKMLYAFFSELQTGRLPAGAEVILLHSGGLQGNPPL